MITLKPHIDFAQSCPHCGRSLVARDVLWQGIHVCATADCSGCGAALVCDLEVGQAIYTPYQADLAKGLLFGDEAQRHWFGEPLIDSLRHPDHDAAITLEVEKISAHTDVVILNCIDYLYGHSLLKLLNSEAHLTSHPDRGLIVIVPRFLRWLVPQRVAEVWVVDVPLSRARHYFPRLDQLIKAECTRFERIYLSRAVSHPATFDITRFSGVERHDFSSASFRITYIWREDRPWCARRLWPRIGKRLPVMKSLLLKRQNYKVMRLFTALRRSFPAAVFTVAGFGTSTRFPGWIDDCRVAAFNDETERQLCGVYRDSRLVVGVHGSSMLLPSAHAGLTIDLMPDDRWPNMAQDLLYQEDDSRMASYRYRYLPLGTGLNTLTTIAAGQIDYYETFKRQMSSPEHSIKGDG
jgi:hypothetical protein